MAQTAVSPCCGYNLERDKVITDGPFTYDPMRPAFLIDGEPVHCRPQVREVLGSLMHARGRTITFDVLAERLGSDAERPVRLIDVALYQARRIFAASPYPCPVQRVRGSGLRWALSAREHEDEA